jgi:hypothetical protein
MSSSWYERNEKTESSADSRLFYGEIFNSYRPDNKGNVLVPIIASMAGYALGSLVSKAKGK